MEDSTDSLELNATPMGTERLKAVAHAKALEELDGGGSEDFANLSDEEFEAEIESRKTAYEEKLIGIYGDNSPEVECFRHGRFVWCPMCAPHLVDKDALG